MSNATEYSHKNFTFFTTFNWQVFTRLLLDSLLTLFFLIFFYILSTISTSASAKFLCINFLNPSAWKEPKGCRLVVLKSLNWTGNDIHIYVKQSLPKNKNPPSWRLIGRGLRREATNINKCTQLILSTLTHWIEIKYNN